jgi:hypothetical protein
MAIRVRYYVWIGVVRFRLQRGLSRWQRFRCWMAGWKYEVEREVMP